MSRLLSRILDIAALLAILLAAMVAISGWTPAHASWKVTTAAVPAKAQATTMPTGQKPNVKGTNLGILGYSYTVTWTATPMVNGYPVTGYIVSRTTAANGSGTILATGTCAGTNLLGISGVVAVPAIAGTTQTCTDTSTVMLSSVMYRVTPVHGNWRGNPSDWAGVTP